MTTAIVTQGTRRAYMWALVMVLAVTIALEAAYYYGGLAGERDGTPIRAITVSALIAGVASSMVWLLTRSAYEEASAEQLGRLSLVLGSLAALSVLGMWIGIFGPICLAAVIFGRKAMTAGETKKGFIGLALGVLGFGLSAILLITAV